MVGKGDAIVQWAVNQSIEYLTPRLQGELSDKEVEQVLKDSKYAWKATRDEAATIGSVTHDWLENHLKGIELPLPDNENACNSIRAALNWLASIDYKAQHVEEILYSPTHGYCGKMDWLGPINGVMSLPDWKTSKSLHDTYRYQTAAYVMAWEEKTGDRIEDRWLIRIDKETGEIEPLHMTRESLEADFNAFLAALTLYRRQAQLRKWNAA
jgi:hypothetical protein